MTGAGSRVRVTLGALRYPWPAAQASFLRLVLIIAGPSLVALSGKHPLARLLAIEVCGISGFFGTVLLNDIADRELDRVAHPERPLASARVRVGDASLLCGALYAITLMSGFYLGRLMFVLVIGWLLVPVAAHYFVLKQPRRTVGGRLYSDLVTPVQFAGAAMFVYIACENYDVLAILLLAGVVYCCDAAMNVLQAIQDSDGDRGFGIATVAARHGARVAARVACGLHCALVPLVVGYAVRARMGWTWLAALGLVWLAGLAVLVRIVLAPSPNHVRRGVAATAVMLQATLVGMGAAKLANAYWLAPRFMLQEFLS